MKPLALTVIQLPGAPRVRILLTRAELRGCYHATCRVTYDDGNETIETIEAAHYDDGLRAYGEMVRRHLAPDI